MLEKIAHRVPHLCTTGGKVFRVFIITEHLFGLTWSLLKLRLSRTTIDMTAALALSITDDFGYGAESSFFTHQQVSVAVMMILTHTKLR